MYIYIYMYIYDIYIYIYIYISDNSARKFLIQYIIREKTHSMIVYNVSSLPNLLF